MLNLGECIAEVVIMGRRHRSSSSSNSGSIGIFFIFLIISGAVAIFPYVLLFLGVLALLFLLVLLVRFFLGKSNQPRTLQHIHAPGNTDFAYRLQRARASDLRIVRYLSDDRSAAEIHNPESGNTYSVTFTSCTCADFKKRNAPVNFFFGLFKSPQKKLHLCKHIMFLMLTNEQYEPLCVEVCGKCNPEYRDISVPIYSDYYNGGPTGPGFCNLYRYSVSGYVHGVSNRTGNPTCQTKTIAVAATSAEEAMQLAKESGVMPPYSKAEMYYIYPLSDAQMGYFHIRGIPYPALINNDDFSALITRYKEQDFEIAPMGLFAIATDLRIVVSYFSSPSQLCAYIWNRLPEDRRPAFYCYAVYCKECRLPIGTAPLPYTHPAFTSFTPDDKYYDYVRHHNDIYNITKRPRIYSIAVEHLRACNIIF